MPYFPIVPSLSNASGMSNRFLSRDLLGLFRVSSSNIVISNLGVLEALQLLSSISKAISNQNLPVDREAISNSIYLVEYKLSMMNFGEGVETLISEKLDLSKALGFAAHLYLHLGVRELPGKARRYQLLFRRLENSLPYERNLLELNDPQISIDLLLWIFFMAGAGIFDNSSRILLMRGLQQLCLVLGIRDINEFETHLKNILWLDPFSSSHSEMLWNELEKYSNV
jgi:hypothetical protein